MQCCFQRSLRPNTLLSQVISAQTSRSNAVSEASASGPLVPAIETHSQHGSRLLSPQRAASPDRHSRLRPESDNMFRFQGHFEAPNNPDLPETHQQSSAALPASAVSVDANPQNLFPASASAAHPAKVVESDNSRQAVAVDADSPGNEPAVDSQQQGSTLIPAATHALQGHRSGTVQESARRRPESEFRRSHSPEWYDARFKRYVLR